MSSTLSTRTTQSAAAASAGVTSTPEEGLAALDFLRNLATEVSGGTVELPCFPDVVIRVRKALDDPRTTTEQAVKIVGAEPRLAARLLQTANSAAFNVSGKPVSDLRAAVTRLGHQLVQGAAMAFAVQQMKDETTLRVIAKPLDALWKESIAVASISQVVARRTKVGSDEAFLTGLLHGIGRLYIMARAASQSHELAEIQSCMELISGWHAAIGKAVLENWGFPEKMGDAVGDQLDYEHRSKHEADLTDVLVASVIIADALAKPEPRTVQIEGVQSFQNIGLAAQDCAAILMHAECQLGSLQDALGC